MSGRPNPRKERRNSDSVPFANYLRKGVIVRVTEHGREPLIAEVTKNYSEVHGTFEVHPLGWAYPIVLHVSGIADVRMSKSDGQALSHAEFREIRRAQREAFERERRAAEEHEPDPEIAQLDEMTPEEIAADFGED